MDLSIALRVRNKYLKYVSISLNFSKTCVSAVISPEPECRVDQDCPNLMVCTQERCVNPCRTNNPCSGNQECNVHDLGGGKKSVACTCPPGHVTGNNDFCKAGKVQYVKTQKYFYSLCIQDTFILSSSSARMCPKL